MKVYHDGDVCKRLFPDLGWEVRTYEFIKYSIYRVEKKVRMFVFEDKKEAEDFEQKLFSASLSDEPIDIDVNNMENKGKYYYKKGEK